MKRILVVAVLAIGLLAGCSTSETRSMKDGQCYNTYSNRVLGIRYNHDTYVDPKIMCDR